MQIDTSGYEMQDWTNVVLRSFDQFPVGEKNDFDKRYRPLPTYLMNWMKKRFGKFEWGYIEEGPDSLESFPSKEIYKLYIKYK